MKDREQDLSEPPFRYLPRTEQQVVAIPETLRQVFQPYLQIIQTSGRFLAERERTFSVGDIAYNVRKYRIGDRDAFSFYSELSDAYGIQERRTVELKTDNNAQIEGVEVVSHKVDEEGEIVGKIWTRIDLGRGTYIEQETEPISVELKDQTYNKQKFIFNSTRDTTSARLIWSKGKEEHPIITITPTEEAVSFNLREIRIDLRTGKRIFEGPIGTFSITTPDQFVAEGIIKAVNLEPIALA